MTDIADPTDACNCGFWPCRHHASAELPDPEVGLKEIIEDCRFPHIVVIKGQMVAALDTDLLLTKLKSHYARYGCDCFNAGYRRCEEKLKAPEARDDLERQSTRELDWQALIETA